MRLELFWFIFIIIDFFCNFWKKVLDQNGPYINTFQTNLRNDCLSVIPELYLSSVVVICVLAPAYTSVCRGLKYSPKARYIIVVDPLWDRYLIFETVFLGRSATLPYVWKIHHKNEQNFCLVAHNFDKFSQNVCLVNTYILIYWHARYDCKLWNTLWFYYVFWAFSCIIIDRSCLNSCTFTKLWLIRCLINIRTLIYWHARCHSKLWNAYWYYSVFCEFCTHLTNIHVWSVLYPPKFTEGSLVWLGSLEISSV